MTTAIKTDVVRNGVEGISVAYFPVTFKDISRISGRTGDHIWEKSVLHSGQLGYGHF